MATKTRRRSSVPVVPIVFVVVVIALIAAFIVSSGPSGAEAEAAFGEPTVEGEALPQHEGEPLDDPVIGETAPELSGTDHDGEPVEVTWDGTPRLLLFLAHWCPACQDEVPWVQDAVDAGEVPDEIEIVAVTTWTDESRAEFPPQDWLESEDWTVPTLADDEDFSAAEAYGMTSSPFWVLVDGDGTVIARIPGGIGEEQFPALLEEFVSDTEG